MDNSKTDIDKLKDFISGSKKVFLTCHEDADADGIGSLLVLYDYLMSLNKDVILAIPGGISSRWAFMAGSDQIKDSLPAQDFVISVGYKDELIEKIRYTTEAGKLNFILSAKDGAIEVDQVTYGQQGIGADAMIVVDTSNLKRLGVFRKRLAGDLSKMQILNIDHHPDNDRFGNINIVDEKRSSCVELIYIMFANLGIKITPNMATNLLAGLYYDTDRFQNINTNSDSFTIAGSLLQLGADHDVVVTQMYRARQLRVLKLWGRALSSVLQNVDYGYVTGVITQHDFKETNTTLEDASGFINEFLSGAVGSKVSALIVEKVPGVFSVQLRAWKAQVRVNEIASAHGGGGHGAAASYEVRGSAESARKAVEEALSNYLVRLDMTGNTNSVPPFKPAESDLESSEIL